MENESSAENNRVIYNKLVRDRILEIIAQGGATCDARILEQEEFIVELTRKLVEEAVEFGQAIDKEDRMKELADLSEIICTLMQELDIKSDDVEAMRIKRRNERGGFDKKIFLQSTEGGSYKK